MDLISHFGLDVLIYAVLAIVFVKAVWKHTSRKLYTWLAAAFVILLPTWDVVLSSLIYYSTCPFIPKATIYEKAETEGIYYEGANRDSIMTVKDWQGRKQIIVTGVSNDFKHGYEYAEALVTTAIENDHMTETPIGKPVIYKCMLLQRNPERPQDDRFQCSPVQDIQSGYLVKLEVRKFALVEINLLKIYNRSTGSLMAEYRDLIFREYGGWTWGPIPFFNWLGVNWNMARHGGDTCPRKVRYLDFQYEVLKVKK